jgi:hypothetical protein
MIMLLAISQQYSTSQKESSLNEKKAVRLRFGKKHVRLFIESVETDARTVPPAAAGSG